MAMTKSIAASPYSSLLRRYQEPFLVFLLQQ
jgi:hypothetical protein